MKCMQRNKVEFYYALFADKVPITDEYGNDTGEFEVVHSDPVKYSANISGAKGEAETRQFGEDLNYDKVIVIDDVDLPIDEYSILWIDTVPELDEDGHLAKDEDDVVLTPHDYIVKKVAKSLNSVSIAVTKVEVS